MTARRAVLFLALLVLVPVGAWGQNAPFTITPTSLPVGGGLLLVGQATTLQLNPSPQLDAGFTWSVSSGNLPPGLTINAQVGAIAGTPTQAGAFTFTVTAVESGQIIYTSSQQYTLFVSLPAPLSLAVVPNPPAAVGNYYLGPTFQAGGGVPGYTWVFQSGTNADGLSLDPNSGQLTGVPQLGGIFPLTVVVTDASGARISAIFNLNVLGIGTASLPNGALGIQYSQTLAVTPGGTGPFTWSLPGGGSIVLPGLTLTPQGQISGTPTAGGTFSFLVQVIDAASNLSTSRSLSITVPAGLTITPTSLPNGATNTVYPAQTLTAAGSTGPFTWAVSSGTLPAGLNLNSSTGVISGTPTQAGTFPFQVAVGDPVAKLTGTQALSITIIAPPTITPATLPSGFVNVPYPATSLTVSGALYTNWAVTAGTLPAGLSLNSSTGALTGTPTVAGSSTFTITASVAGTATVVVPPVVQQFTIVINAVTITAPTIGVAATQPTATVALTGGPYPLTITGTLNLTFASASGGAQLYDAKFANGSGTTATFTIPAGSTATSIPVIIGTVAGKIHITTTSLVDSAGNTLQAPADAVITVNPAVPVITNVTFKSGTNGGFSISVIGYSTPRDMTSALFQFTSPTNTQLASANVTVLLTTAFTSWYSNTASNAFGSTFTMTVQFSFTGPPGTTFPCLGATVTMTNSQGASNALGTTCQAVTPVP